MSNIDWLMLIIAGGCAAFVFICVLIMLRVVDWCFGPIADELT